jgi:NADH dehydrogenase
MLHTIQRRRLILGLPFWLGRLIGGASDIAGRITGGLLSGPVTRDQVKNLRRDNVVAEGAKGFADLGISPMATEAVLPQYLWRFRPSGQYAEIKNSAKNLRKI